MMERRREERGTNYDRRMGEPLAHGDRDRQVAALGRSVDLIVYSLGQSLGGWWAERDATTTTRQVTFDDDVVYRAHYDFSPTRLADRSYEVVRPAYLIGHIAGANPSYDGLPFESIEGDLRSGWSEEIRAKHGDWDAVRHYAQEAFGRQRQRELRKSGEQRRVSSEHRAEYESGGSV